MHVHCHRNYPKLILSDNHSLSTDPLWIALWQVEMRSLDCQREAYNRWTLRRFFRFEFGLSCTCRRWVHFRTRCGTHGAPHQGRKTDNGRNLLRNITVLMHTIYASHILLSRQLNKCSSCVALYSLTMSPSSSGNAPLSCNISPWRLFQTFLRHESSHVKLVPQYSAAFPCDPSYFSFNPQASCLLCRDPAVFENLNRFGILTYSFVPHLLQLAAVHQLWSHFLRCITRAFSAPHQNFCLPVHSSHHVMSSHMLLSPFSPKKFSQVLRPCAFALNVSCAYCLFHISKIDTCGHQHTTPFDASFLPFSYTKIHFSFGLSSSQSFHPSTRQ